MIIFMINFIFNQNFKNLNLKIVKKFVIDALFFDNFYLFYIILKSNKLNKL